MVEFLGELEHRGTESADRVLPWCLHGSSGRWDFLVRPHRLVCDLPLVSPPELIRAFQVGLDGGSRPLRDQSAPETLEHGHAVRATPTHTQSHARSAAKTNSGLLYHCLLEPT